MNQRKYLKISKTECRNSALVDHNFEELTFLSRKEQTMLSIKSEIDIPKCDRQYQKQIDKKYGTVKLSLTYNSDKVILEN